MSWTAPKTWTVGEIVTAANMNTHLRDNLLALYNLGSSPPSSPTDGTHWIYNGVAGFFWHFIYDSSETTYKWKFVGGPPLSGFNDGNNTIGGTGYADLTNGVSFTLARAGDYIVEWGGRFDTNAPPTFNCWLGPFRNAANPSDAESVSVTARQAQATSDQKFGSKLLTATGLPASDTVKLRVRVDGGSMNVDRVWMKIIPKRVT